jgi:hypothetical protein
MNLRNLKSVREKSIEWFKTLTMEEKLILVKRYLPNRPFRDLDMITGREIEEIYTKMWNHE